MRAVENVRFHPRQILQPGEDFSAVEEAVVPSPQQKRGRLMFVQVSSDVLESGGVTAVVGYQGALQSRWPG